MQDNNETEEIKQLKREIAKLRLEGNLRKSLSNQLTIQKKIADDAKAEALTKSEEVAKISNQLAKYLSPQIHEQIFSGKQSAEVKSNRKKLTVFFSDIVNFTDISDELESEEMTNLLNFYLNEMSQIALKFGGTIDKFIGDALMIFFGDPESKGPQEDAKQCIQMALEMQDLMTQLSDYWSKNYSLKKELKIRIGINTGFLHYLLLGLMSLAAVAGLQTVGIILVVAMLVTPGATAYLLTDRFDRMTILAILSSVLSSVLGVFISYWTDSSTAGCIVLVQTAQFIFAFLLAPRHGILRSHHGLTS